MECFIQMDGERCQGITKKGERCRKPPSKDKAFCHVHLPSTSTTSTTSTTLVHDLDDICPICLEGKDSTEELFVLSCNHKVHLKCVIEVADEGCVLCRQPMENLPDDVAIQIAKNVEIFKGELQEEDHRAAQQAQRMNSINRLFSVYIRPRPQIEMKYAMLYLRSQGIPLRYLPQGIKILVPRGHPEPPRGTLFSAIIGQTMERMKEDISSHISDSQEDSDSGEETEAESYPFRDQDERLRNIQRFLETATVNPQTFVPLDPPVIIHEG